MQLLQHLPDPRTHLLRRYGLYSSRSRGTWARKPWLVPLAPQGWLQQHAQQTPSRTPRDTPGGSGQPPVCPKASRSAFHGTPRSWARLLAKVYEVDVLRCGRCGSSMRVLALIKTGLAPPGLQPSALS